MLLPTSTNVSVTHQDSRNVAAVSTGTTRTIHTESIDSRKNSIARPG